ncbi:AAA family ATPase [Taklimakanibacter deserti]|uniref:AAA family ATPase n=1 Tax=Taklimakanibacter deserti TaxID=2267839 RepID=UPI000E658DC8
MICLPILESLTIEKYALYPSSAQIPFTATFQPGGTAVIGINGSGKSTLINICFRCLTGPSNLPTATSSGELGQVRPRAVPMTSGEARLFSNRVADGAATATATLKFALGDASVVVTRKLSDLSLVAMHLDLKDRRGRTQVVISDEKAFQEKLSELIGVGAFFDVLVILTFLTFMQEDRRSLVWDATAQRQILRVLLLPIEDATEFAIAQQEGGEKIEMSTGPAEGISCNAFPCRTEKL